MWDLQAFKKPLCVRSELPALYSQTNAIFSPDDKYIVTGAGATVKGGTGRLLFLRKDDLEVEKTLEVGATPVKVFWHSKINQVRWIIHAHIRFIFMTLIVTTTDCNRIVQWTDMRAVFASHLVEWSQAVSEQRTSEKGYS